MHNHENKCDILFASNYAALKLNFDNFVKMEANEILPYIKQTKLTDIHWYLSVLTHDCKWNEKQLLKSVKKYDILVL